MSGGGSFYVFERRIKRRKKRRRFIRSISIIICIKIGRCERHHAVGRDQESGCIGGEFVRDLDGVANLGNEKIQKVRRKSQRYVRER